MKPQLTTWLLATLLTLTSGLGVPASRLGTNTVEYHVCCLNARDRSAQRLAKRDPQPLGGTEFTLAEVNRADDSAGLLTDSDTSLFQRPPPATSPRRS